MLKKGYNTPAKKAFTLIELVASVTIMSVIFIAVFNLLSFAVTTYKKAIIYSELFHSASIAMDFFETQLRGAKEAKLTATRSGSMLRLEVSNVTGSDDSIKTLKSEFSFDSTNTSNNYHRLNFGGSNELAVYIEDIKMSLNDKKNIISIEITTDTRLARGIREIRFPDVSLKKPIVLKREIYLKHAVVS
ncbi:MAG: type II secretion system GspH family protein [Clostridiales bacterium]|jgi:prepilin-type N-terminal cleavage/methylation domain-containing protein|nr:type II secretion system GspH family protein [Clostridiales bacterium]